MNWDMDYAIDIFPDILEAFVKYTLWVTFLSSILAAVVGLLFAIIRFLHVPVLSQVITGFVEFVRSTPIPVQLFFLFYVFPDYGILVGATTIGVLCLGLHYACYYAEVYRAGIEAVPKGQWEAATALSLPQRYTWQHIVLPQAVRIILPSLGNYVISMFKETPFLFVISVPEMVFVAKELGAQSFDYVEPLTIAGLIFLAASYPAAVALRRLEKHLGHA